MTVPSSTTKETIKLQTIAELAYHFLESKITKGQALEIIKRNRLDPRTIKTAIQKAVSSGTIVHRPKTGRPPKLTPDKVTEIKTLVNSEGGDLTLADIKTNLDLTVSERTIAKHMHNIGLYSFKKIKATYLDTTDKAKRLEWCRKYANWTYKD